MVRSSRDRAFDLLVNLMLLLIGLTAIFPLLYVVSVSLTPFSEVLRNGGYVIIPRSITLEAYAQFLSRPEVPRAFAVTLFITVVGTLINMALTTLMAYPLSRRNLPGRNAILFAVLFTFLFSGGLIPTYLVVKATRLINTVWAMIIPTAIWSFNVLVLKSFFETLPEEILESARLDGAGEFRILMQMVIPLSVPALLTVGLFYAVGHWNELFQAIIYVSDQHLQPLQVVLRNILRQSEQRLNENAENIVPTATLQMAAVVLATLPILVVYPFIQKHFTKGVMLGSIKG